MKTNRILPLIFMSAILATSAAWGSEVYINQTGNEVLVNVEQTQGNNTINSSGDPAIISGDNIELAITQTGDLNMADIMLANYSNDTVLTYSAIGNFNMFTVNFDNAINNQISIDKSGDFNTVSICGDIPCNSVSDVSDSITVVNIDGSFNAVRFALGADGVNNSVSITGGSLNSRNVVNINQHSGSNHVTDVGITGGGNSVTIIQGL